MSAVADVVLTVEQDGVHWSSSLVCSEVRALQAAFMEDAACGTLLGRALAAKYGGEWREDVDLLDDVAVGAPLTLKEPA